MGELATAVTDLFMAWCCLFWIPRLNGKTWRVPVPIALWECAFLCIAWSALCGCIYHGLNHADRFQLATYGLLIIANFFLLGGALWVTMSFSMRVFRARTISLVLIIMITTVFFRELVLTKNPAGATFYTFCTIVFLLVIGILWGIHGNPAGSWLVSSMGIACIAGLIYLTHMDVAPWFDHNATFHVIQTVSLWFLYRSGLALRNTS